MALDYDDLLLVKWILSIVVGAIILMASITFLVAKFAEYQCAAQADLMKVDYQFGVVVGCMVKTKSGEFVPLKNYRVVG